MAYLNLKHILASCAVLGVLMVAAASGEDHSTTANHGRFPLYDNFETKRLDPQRWFGEQRATGGSGGLEIARRVNRLGHLIMWHRVAGGDESNSGRHISRNRLRIADDAPMSGMQFDTMVKYVKLGACAALGASKAAAKLRGAMFMFNDGESTGAGDARGDIGAVVEISHDTRFEEPRHEYSVRGFIFRCETRGCGTSGIVESVDLGTVRRREVVSLGMEWHADNKAVSFWKNAEELSVTYGDRYDHVNDPILTNNRLEVRVEGANCADSESFAEMSALFDNVEVKR